LNKRETDTYRIETRGVTRLDIEVREANIRLQGTDEECLIASLYPGGYEKGHPVSLDVRQEGDTIFIRGGNGQKLTRQTVTVRIPPTLKRVRAHTRQGDLRVQNLSDVELELHTRKGDAQLNGTAGQIHLNVSAGDVEANSLRGKIELTTGRGDIKISQIHGEEITLRVGYGDIVIKQLTGNAHCTAGKGDIAATRLGGQAEIRTGMGDIVLSTLDDLKAHLHTGMGDIHLHEGSLRELEAKTGNGDITLYADLREGQFEMHSGRGDLVAMLSPEANVRFEAVTSSGDLRSDVPGVRVGRPGPVPKAGGRLVGVMGDGRAHLSLKTGRGDVRIRLKKGHAKRRRPSPVSGPSVEAEGVGAIPQEPSAEPSAEAASSPPLEEATVLQILNALQRGEISVEEAERLLADLGFTNQRSLESVEKVVLCQTSEVFDGVKIAKSD